MSSDERDAALPDRRDHLRKRSRSPDPPPAAVVDTNSPSLEQIQPKRARLETHDDVAAHDPSVESKSPSIIESAVSQIKVYLENRLDKVKEDLRVWESNGILSFSSAAALSFFSFSHCTLF